jgi:hypothetical protein
MTRLIVISSLLISIFLVPQMAQAAIYYVATTGNDNYATAQAQDPATPWRTIQRCLNNVAPGDTCTVMNGTYAKASIIVNGSPSLPITLKAQNRYGAVINLPTITNAANDGLSVFGKQHYIIDGFDIQGAGGSGSTAANTGVNVQNSTNITVKNMKIHGMNRTICTASEYGSQGIYIENVTDFVGENNILFSIGRLLQGESGCGIDDHVHDHGYYIKSGTNITVRGNLIYDTFRGWPIHVYGGTVKNLNIYNNTLADNASIYNPGQIVLAHSIATANIKNNVCYNPLLWCVSYSSMPSFTNVVVDHNVSTAAMDGGNRPSGMFFLDNLDKKIASELFKNPLTRDYTPKLGSPTIDNGLSISEVALDLVGTRRPQINGHDIGAIELSGTANTGSPAAPKGLRVQ